MDTGEIVSQAIEPLRERISIYDGPQVFLSGLLDVGREQGLLYSVHWCVSEVCNGGFHQFFYNSTGVLCPEALRGFEYLGFQRAVGIVSRAASLLGSPYPREHELRNARLQSILRPGKEREKWDPFYPLDEDFYEWKAEDSFLMKTDEFVKRHLDVFFQ